MSNLPALPQVSHGKEKSVVECGVTGWPVQSGILLHLSFIGASSFWKR